MMDWLNAGNVAVALISINCAAAIFHMLFGKQETATLYVCVSIFLVLVTK